VVYFQYISLTHYDSKARTYHKAWRTVGVRDIETIPRRGMPELILPRCVRPETSKQYRRCGMPELSARDIFNRAGRIVRFCLRCLRGRALLRRRGIPLRLLCRCTCINQVMHTTV
jgi:hypothetical protein